MGELLGNKHILPTTHFCTLLVRLDLFTATHTSLTFYFPPAAAPCARAERLAALRAEREQEALKALEAAKAAEEEQVRMRAGRGAWGRAQAVVGPCAGACSKQRVCCSAAHVYGRTSHRPTLFDSGPCISTANCSGWP